MTLNPWNWIATGLVAAGLAGTALIARPEPTFGQQVIVRNLPPIQVPALATSDQPTAAEFEVRLQYAEERLRLVLKLRESGQLSELDAVTAREEVAVLRGLVDALSDRLEDAIQLLRIEKEVRQAELRQAQANLTGLALLKKSAERLSQTGAVSTGEVAMAEAKLAAAQGDVLVKQVRIRETDARIEQAARRLEQIESLSVKQPAPAPIPEATEGR